ncbi:hypothetical protein [Shewanella algae]|uniref:hypothetical protein n=1 Tax=Shewanella algae TaxID=38313 RepID=UPI001183ED5F|nr:hypothetical protein [Shewanella algae]TVO80170.1 hypothetical protein AYI78_20145 [Shewanella algae]TVO80261.1 hypothetical protein AYI76_20295 [Shewanella algae]TVO90577.1 hypothetical protein AYI79_20215 [Shewanella algae]
MRKLTSSLIAAALVVPAAFTSGHVLATTADQMEVITVTYRSSLNYALYQQITETMAGFHLDVLEDIYAQARGSNLEMAEQFYQQQNIQVAANRLPAQLERVLQQPE